MSTNCRHDFGMWGEVTQRSDYFVQYRYCSKCGLWGMREVRANV